MPPYPFASHPSDASDGSGAESSGLTEDESLVELRCSAVVIRRAEVLLIRRPGRSGSEEWILPGGRPRPGEGMLSCVRREVAEESGLVVLLDRCAFVADVIDPEGTRRRAELVFVARVSGDQREALTGEPGAEPCWVSMGELRRIHMRPPIGGFLPGVVKGSASTAPYLGNPWRPDDDAGTE